jgi:hypothetical protein
MALVELYGDDKDGELLEVPEPLPSSFAWMEDQDDADVPGPTKFRTYELRELVGKDGRTRPIYVQEGIADKLAGD